MVKFGFLLQKTLISLLQLYRWVISPLFGNHCIFKPSCSHYAQLAIREHGVVVGLGLVVRRLLRCHPWHAGGYDAVPKSIKSDIPITHESVNSPLQVQSLRDKSSKGKNSKFSL